MNNDRIYIDDNIGKVITVISLHANLSDKQVAKMCDLSVSKVRKIKNLIDGKVTHRRCFIDVARIGLNVYGFFVFLSPNGQKLRKEILEYLSENKFVSYLASYDDKVTLKIGIVGKCLSIINTILEDLSGKFGSVLKARAVYQIDYFYDYGHNFSNIERKRCFCFGKTRSDEVIDDLDKKILNQYSGPQKKTDKEIADYLGISQSKLSFRYDRLRKNNIILGERVVVDFPETNHMAVTHLVTFDLLSKEIEDAIVNYTRNESNIYYLARCSSGWDFEIGSYNEDEKELKITEEKLKRFFYKAGITIKSYKIDILEKISQYPFN